MFQKQICNVGCSEDLEPVSEFTNLRFRTWFSYKLIDGANGIAPAKVIHTTYRLCLRHRRAAFSVVQIKSSSFKSTQMIQY